MINDQKSHLYYLLFSIAWRHALFAPSSRLQLVRKWMDDTRDYILRKNRLAMPFDIFLQVPNQDDIDEYQHHDFGGFYLQTTGSATGPNFHEDGGGEFYVNINLGPLHATFYSNKLPDCIAHRYGENIHMRLIENATSFIIPHMSERPSIGKLLRDMALHIHHSSTQLCHVKLRENDSKKIQYGPPLLPQEFTIFDSATNQLVLRHYHKLPVPYYHGADMAIDILWRDNQKLILQNPLQPIDVLVHSYEANWDGHDIWVWFVVSKHGDKVKLKLHPTNRAIDTRIMNWNKTRTRIRVVCLHLLRALPQMTTCLLL